MLPFDHRTMRALLSFCGRPSCRVPPRWRAVRFRTGVPARRWTAQVCVRVLPYLLLARLAHGAGPAPADRLPDALELRHAALCAAGPHLGSVGLGLERLALYMHELGQARVKELCSRGQAHAAPCASRGLERNREPLPTAVRGRARRAPRTFAPRKLGCSNNSLWTAGPRASRSCLNAGENQRARSRRQGRSANLCAERPEARRTP